MTHYICEAKEVPRKPEALLRLHESTGLPQEIYQSINQ